MLSLLVLEFKAKHYQLELGAPLFLLYYSPPRILKYDMSRYILNGMILTYMRVFGLVFFANGLSIAWPKLDR